MIYLSVPDCLCRERGLGTLVYKFIFEFLVYTKTEFSYGFKLSGNTEGGKGRNRTIGAQVSRNFEGFALFLKFLFTLILLFPSLTFPGT